MQNLGGQTKSIMVFSGEVYSLEEQRGNSLCVVQTSEVIHSFDATDPFGMAKDGHTHQAI